MAAQSYGELLVIAFFLQKAEEEVWVNVADAQTAGITKTLVGDHIVGDHHIVRLCDWLWSTAAVDVG